jgi:hypothetical protein
MWSNESEADNGMASIEHYLAVYHKRRARIIRTLERYRNGVYQCGKIVDTEHIDTTHRGHGSWGRHE